MQLFALSADDIFRCILLALQGLISERIIFPARLTELNHHFRAQHANANDTIHLELSFLLETPSEVFNSIYCETCLKWSLKNRQNIDLNDKRKNCRMFCDTFDLH